MTDRPSLPPKIFFNDALASRQEHKCWLLSMAIVLEFQEKEGVDNIQAMDMLKQSGLPFPFSSFLFQISIIALLFLAEESNALSLPPNRSSHRFVERKRNFRTNMSTEANDQKFIAESIEPSLPTFPNRIPDERLGTKHESLEAFHRAAFGTTSRPAKKTKEYTLIVVTETQEHQKEKRILLGLKNRGFGMGKYNSFGGKFLHDESKGDGTQESVEECACRELEEETNLCIPLKSMRSSKVGIQRFSFSDNDKEMLVHLFFLDLAKQKNHDYEIRACEEITPKWFETFDSVPLDNMFADDSLWLTALLTQAASIETPVVGPPLVINGSYHFAENCEETNTILHYHMEVRTPPM